MSFKSGLKNIFYLCTGLTICIYFSACTNIDKNECRKTHWPTQGFEDGQEGRPSRLSMFLAKCSAFDIKVDNAAYLESYDKGLDTFCSEDSAFSRGFQGLTPEKVCSQKIKYTTSYKLGVQSFCSPEIGNKDALEGKPANVFCGSKSKYFSGYLAGMSKFCTYENGFKLGFEGKALNPMCKDELKLNFELGFNNGRKDYLIKDTRKVQNNIDLAEKELRMVKDRYTEKLSAAYEIPQNTEDPVLQVQRQQLDVEIKLLKEKKSKLEQNIFEFQKLINANNAEIGKMTP